MANDSSRYTMVQITVYRSLHQLLPFWDQSIRPTSAWQSSDQGDDVTLIGRDAVDGAPSLDHLKP